jgi:hypothetical protein
MHGSCQTVAAATPAGVGSAAAMTARPIASGVLLLALAAPGCGDESTHVNDDRPASAVNVTASIVDGRLNVSPTEFGAGPVRFLVTNQGTEAVRLTFETAGSAAGTTARSSPVAPDTVTTMQVDTEEGEYELRASDGQIEPVAITVGAARPSGQNELLQP